MNTVLSEDAKINITDKVCDKHKTTWLEATMPPKLEQLVIDIYDEVATQQDAHTRLELAKAVREIENHYKPCTKSHAGFHQAISAVLKVMEGE